MGNPHTDASTPMLTDTEVSEVSSVAPEPMSQDAMTPQGESF